MGPVLHADLAEVSSTDIIKRGFGSNLEITGSGDSVLRQCGTSFLLRGARHFLLAGLVVCLTLGSFAAPKAKNKGVSIEVARALQITRGKQIDAGLVFLDGKFLPPPYVVERYGNALRINGIQVTRALIPWGRFLMTQEGASVVTEESAAAVQPVAETKQPAAVDPTPTPEPKPQPKPKPAAKPTRAEVAAGNYLESLFDDDETEDECVIIDENETDFGTILPPKKTKGAAKAKPQTKQASTKSAAVVKPAKVTPPAEPTQPRVRKRVQFNGNFVMNAKCKQMVERMNKRRANVDTTLRNGGFVFFSSKHSWTSGDGGAGTRLLAKLPELMKDANSEQEFLERASAAKLNFVQEDDLRLFYKNRLDCFKLIKRRNELKEKAKMNSFLESQRK